MLHGVKDIQPEPLQDYDKGPFLFPYENNNWTVDDY